MIERRRLTYVTKEANELLKEIKSPSDMNSRNQKILKLNTLIKQLEYFQTVFEILGADNDAKQVCETKDKLKNFKFENDVNEKELKEDKANDEEKNNEVNNKKTNNEANEVENQNKDNETSKENVNNQIKPVTTIKNYEITTVITSTKDKTTYEETLYTTKLNSKRYDSVKILLPEFKNFYMFKPNSPLKEFFKTKKVMLTKYFTFYHVYVNLQKIIKNEKLRDPANPVIIICPPDLEKVFNTILLHDNEIYRFLFMHLIKASNELQSLLHDIYKNPVNRQKKKAFKFLKEDIDIVQSKKSISSCILNDPRYKFTISFNLRTVLNKVPTFQCNEIFFSWKEICDCLSNYILQRKNYLFDPRNISIAFVKYDLLGHVFGVQAFHRYQVSKLLSKHVVPVSNK
jgi:SWIB/MDM2 domain